MAADGGAARDEREHPQVRGNRDPPGGEPQRDRRGARLLRRDRPGPEGGAVAVPARPLGQAAREAAGGEDPHLLRSGPVVRARVIPARRAHRWDVYTVPLCMTLITRY